MPDFNRFSRVFKQYEDMPTKVEKYTEFTENHTRMVEASKISKIEFNWESHISKPWEAVKTADLFSSQEVVDTFKKGNEIEVSDRFFGKVKFFDNSGPKKDDDLDTKKLKRWMKNSQIGYVSPDPSPRVDFKADEPDYVGTLYIKSSTNKDLFVNGGYFHEKFHAQIIEQNQQEFQNIDDRFSLQQHKHMRELARSFEEVAADARTHEFMGYDQKFLDQVYNKYNINDTSKVGIDRKVFSLMNNMETDHDKIIKRSIDLIEMLGTFKNLDERTYDYILESIDRHKHNLDPQLYSALMDIGKISSQIGTGSDIVGLLLTALDRFKKVLHKMF